MKTIPSILTYSQEEFTTQLTRLSPFFSRFQVDIANNTLVPNTTVQIEEIDSLITSPITLDFHLMVEDYENQLEKLQELSKLIKINVIFLHFSLLPKYEILNTKYKEFTFGLVLNPEDTVESVAKQYDLLKLEHIQIMTIHPGFQGEAFLPETIQKVQHLRSKDYKSSIYFDGAMNEETIKIVLSQEYQPDFICPGSFLSKAENIEERIKWLKSVGIS